MSSSELLEVRGLDVAWGPTPVLSGVDLDVRERELVVLMGPNGSGKTTLLRTIVGLERPRAGSIRLRGRSLDGVPTHRRGIGMLFQEPALFPHRSVWENVAYGLQIARRAPADVDRRVDGMLELLRLTTFADRRPEALSGGERQRVALARTLAPEPALVLLDEPFASVDLELRRDLRSEFGRALRATGTAALHVTHDREEGLVLADRVALLLGGRVAVEGRPEVVYREPPDADAARFLGYNVVRSEGSDLAVAPVDVALGPPSAGGVSGRVVTSAFAGRDQLVEVVLDDGAVVECRLPLAGPLPAVGETVGVRWTSGRKLPGRGPTNSA